MEGMLNMECKFCKSQEELKWPEPYKDGDKPIIVATGKPHKHMKESDAGFLDTSAPSVGIQSTLVDGSNPNSVSYAQSVEKDNDGSTD